MFMPTTDGAYTQAPSILYHQLLLLFVCVMWQYLLSLYLYVYNAHRSELR